MKDLSQEILKKIKHDKIQPKPRWQFLLKDVFVWGLGGISLVIGSLASSVVIYMILNNDWEEYMHLSDSLFEFIFITLPYFWLLLLVLFIIIVEYNIRNTKKGYKLNLPVLTFGTVFFSVLFGAFLYSAGIGKAIDNKLAENIPTYDKFFNKDNQRMKMWMRPEKGVLMGVIVTMDDERYFRISDFRDEVWNIFAEEAILPSQMEIQIGYGVKLIGENYESPFPVNEGEKSFKATKILAVDSIEMLMHHPDVIDVMHERLMNKPLKRNEIPMLFEEHPDYLERAKEAQKRFENDKQGKVDVPCDQKEDCELPFMFAIRSNCPFTSKCIENKCKVICPEPYKSIEEAEEKKFQCEENEDCDCSYYKAPDFDMCLCLDNICSVVIK